MAAVNVTEMTHFFLKKNSKLKDKKKNLYKKEKKKKTFNVSNILQVTPCDPKSFQSLCCYNLVGSTI